MSEYTEQSALNILSDRITELLRENRELQRALSEQILVNPKEKIEIKFSDEAQAKAMIAIVKENRELLQANLEYKKLADEYFMQDRVAEKQTLIRENRELRERIEKMNNVINDGAKNEEILQHQYVMLMGALKIITKLSTGDSQCCQIAIATAKTAIGQE